jgi:hypothetical protein
LQILGECTETPSGPDRGSRSGDWAQVAREPKFLAEIDGLASSSKDAIGASINPSATNDGHPEFPPHTL